jgi:hypothetical protein
VESSPKAYLALFAGSDLASPRPTAVVTPQLRITIPLTNSKMADEDKEKAEKVAAAKKRVGNPPELASKA